MANVFDDISRTLATPMPRSHALKLIVGALIGTILTPLGFAQGRGGNREPCPGARGDSCPPGQKCCGGFCCPHPHTCCGNTCCPPPKDCVNGVCVQNKPTNNQP